MTTNLSNSQVESVQIGEELGETIKFRYQLFNITTIEDCFPRGGNRIELAVGAIKFAALKAYMETGEGFHPHQVVQDTARIGVVGEVVRTLRQTTWIDERVVPMFVFVLIDEFEVNKLTNL